MTPEETTKLYGAIKIETRPVVIGLPTTMYVEYFGLIDGTTEFVIYRPRDDWDYGDFRCVMRPAGMPCFVACEIVSVTRYRDGGTTDVELPAGSFHFPTPFDRNAKPTFAGREIVVHERLS